MEKKYFEANLERYASSHSVERKKISNYFDIVNNKLFLIHVL